MLSLKQALKFTNIFYENSEVCGISINKNIKYFTVQELKNKFDLKNTLIKKIKFNINIGGYDTIIFIIR